MQSLTSPNDDPPRKPREENNLKVIIFYTSPAERTHMFDAALVGVTGHFQGQCDASSGSLNLLSGP